MPSWFFSCTRTGSSALTTISLISFISSYKKNLGSQTNRHLKKIRLLNDFIFSEQISILFSFIPFQITATFRMVFYIILQITLQINNGKKLKFQKAIDYSWSRVFQKFFEVHNGIEKQKIILLNHVHFNFVKKKSIECYNTIMRITSPVSPNFKEVFFDYGQIQGRKENFIDHKTEPLGYSKIFYLIIFHLSRKHFVHKMTLDISKLIKDKKKISFGLLNSKWSERFKYIAEICSMKEISLLILSSSHIKTGLSHLIFKWIQNITTLNLSLNKMALKSLKNSKVINNEISSNKQEDISRLEETGLNDFPSNLRNDRYSKFFLKIQSGEIGSNLKDLEKFLSCLIRGNSNDIIKSVILTKLDNLRTTKPNSNRVARIENSIIALDKKSEINKLCKLLKKCCENGFSEETSLDHLVIYFNFSIIPFSEISIITREHLNLISYNEILISLEQLQFIPSLMLLNKIQLLSSSFIFFAEWGKYSTQGSRIKFILERIPNFYLHVRKEKTPYKYKRLNSLIGKNIKNIFLRIASSFSFILIGFENFQIEKSQSIDRKETPLKKLHIKNAEVFKANKHDYLLSMMLSVGFLIYKNSLNLVKLLPILFSIPDPKIKSVSTLFAQSCFNHPSTSIILIQKSFKKLKNTISFKFERTNRIYRIQSWAKERLINSGSKNKRRFIYPENSRSFLKSVICAKMTIMSICFICYGDLEIRDITLKMMFVFVFSQELFFADFLIASIALFDLRIVKLASVDAISKFCRSNNLTIVKNCVISYLMIASGTNNTRILNSLKYLADFYCFDSNLTTSEEESIRTRKKYFIRRETDCLVFLLRLAQYLISETYLSNFKTKYIERRQRFKSQVLMVARIVSNLSEWNITSCSHFPISLFFLKMIDSKCLDFNLSSIGKIRSSVVMEYDLQKINAKDKVTPMLFSNRYFLD